MVKIKRRESVRGLARRLVEHYREVTGDTRTWDVQNEVPDDVLSIIEKIGFQKFQESDSTAKTYRQVEDYITLELTN